MNITEITNGLQSEGRPLADVHDLLAGAVDDGVKARILNRPEWVTVPAEGDQKFYRDLIRANGQYGNPDAQVYADVAEQDLVADLRPIWGIQLDEATRVEFRRQMIGEREVVSAIWTYWESDLPEFLDVYRDDLDRTIEGNDEIVKYTRSRMYADLLHVPIYDDEGFLVVADEAPRTAEQMFEDGDMLIESSFARAYKAQVTSAEAFFPTAQSAFEWAQLVRPYAFKTERQRQAEAMRRSVPGAQVRSTVPQRRSVPVRPTSVVRDTPAPKKGLIARLFGR